MSGDGFRQIEEAEKQLIVSKAKENHETELEEFYGTQFDLLVKGEVESTFNPLAKQYVDNPSVRENVIAQLQGKEVDNNMELEIEGEDGEKATFSVAVTPPNKVQILQNGVALFDDPIETLAFEDERGVPKASYNKKDILMLDGQAYLLKQKRLGGGENGGVLHAVNLANGDEVVIKVQMGVLIDGSIELKDPDEALREHLVGAKFSPDGGQPLSIAVGVISIDRSSPIIRAAINDHKEEDKEKRKVIEDKISQFEKAADNDLRSAVVLVQRKMPGKSLGDVRYPEQPSEATVEQVRDKIALAYRVLSEVIRFKDETGLYHMDIRPENIMVDGANVYLIDPGAAGNYEKYKAVGNTYGYTHPEIMKIALEKTEVGVFDSANYSIEAHKENPETKRNNLPEVEGLAVKKSELRGGAGYVNEHEAYAVRAVMRFMGIDKMIDMLPTEADRAQFADVRAMLRETPGLSNDMTLESMAEKMQAALVQKQENVSSDEAKANSQSPPPSPEQPALESIPSTPPPAMTTGYFNKQDSDSGLGSTEEKKEKSFFQALRDKWEEKSRDTQREKLPTPEAQSKMQGKSGKGGKG